MKKYEIGTTEGTVLVDVEGNLAADFISSVVGDSELVEFVVERMPDDERVADLIYPQDNDAILEAIANIGTESSE